MGVEQAFYSPKLGGRACCWGTAACMLCSLLGVCGILPNSFMRQCAAVFERRLGMRQTMAAHMAACMLTGHMAAGQVVGGFSLLPLLFFFLFLHTHLAFIHELVSKRDV